MDERVGQEDASRAPAHAMPCVERGRRMVGHRAQQVACDRRGGVTGWVGMNESHVERKIFGGGDAFLRNVRTPLFYLGRQLEARESREELLVSIHLDNLILYFLTTSQFIG